MHHYKLTSQEEAQQYNHQRGPCCWRLPAEGTSAWSKRGLREPAVSLKYLFKRPGKLLICCLPWPALQYVCWAELVLAQLLVPGSSFWGHLCGILAGILHVKVLSKVGPFAPGRTAAARRGFSSGVYSYGSGYGSGSRGRYGSTSRRGGRNGWGNWVSGSIWEAIFGRPSGRRRGSARTYGHGTWGGGDNEGY